MWTGSVDCLLAAPPDITTANSLKSTCTRASLSEENMCSIENLFHRTLGIRDATDEDTVTELKRLRESSVLMAAGKVYTFVKLGLLSSSILYDVFS